MLGYDLDQCCCENADWYISDNAQPTAKEIDRVPQELPDVETWRFDPTFHKITDKVLLDAENTYNPLDAGSVATFRLVSLTDQEKFLHLFNCHNGYYGHGFTFSVGDQGIEEGVL
jgi:hypothetical protein